VRGGRKQGWWRRGSKRSERGGMERWTVLWGWTGEVDGAVGFRLRDVPKLERSAGAPRTCSQTAPRGDRGTGFGKLPAHS
jgi:hypothetical protein